MDKKHIISGLFWLAVSVFVATVAVDLEIGTLHKPGPGFIFFWSSVALGVLSAIMIVNSISRKGDAVSVSTVWKGLKWRNALIAVVALFLYAFILAGLGFVLSTFLLMIVLFRIGRSSYQVVIVSALITTAASFLVFHYFLEVHLPRGIIGW